MAENTMIIKNGRVFDEEGRNALTDIKIEQGKITEVGMNINEDQAQVIDAAGHYVLPGFIDLNCSISDPGYESEEDIETGSMAAAKGGFTTVSFQPDTAPAIDNKTVVSYVISRNKTESRVNTLVYGSMTMGCKGVMMSDIGEMVNAGITALSDGGCSISDSFLMRNILLYAKKFDIPVIAKCDDGTLSRKGVINSGKIATVTGLEGIPEEAEEIIVARNLILAKNTGGRLHLTGISTKTSVDIIRYAKSQGIPVTCDTYPQYFSLTQEDVRGYNVFRKVIPPLRTDRDVEAIREGLKDGTIDVIASGHHPDTIENKKMEFDNAGFGISSLETAYAISYEYLVENDVLTYREMIDKLTVNAAKVLGKTDMGRILKGYQGDVVIINRDKTYTINPEQFLSKAKYSPFRGYEVKGAVLDTIVSGKLVYSAR